MQLTRYSDYSLRVLIYLAVDPDRLVTIDDIAQSYLEILRQPRSAWTWEVELRPWVETF